MKTLQSLNLNDIFTYVKNLLNVQSKTNVQLNIVPNNCLVAAVSPRNCVLINLLFRFVCHNCNAFLIMFSLLSMI